MLKKFIILIVDFLIEIVNYVLFIINLFISCSAKLWKNNIVRKFVLKIIDGIILRFHYFKNYLEYIKNSITFRIIYKRVTFPMKTYYKKLKKRNNVRIHNDISK